MDHAQWVSLDRAARASREGTLSLATAYQDKGANLAHILLRICALQWVYPQPPGTGAVTLADVTVSNVRYQLRTFWFDVRGVKLFVQRDELICSITPPEAATTQSWYATWPLGRASERLQLRVEEGKEHWHATDQAGWRGVRGIGRYLVAANLLKECWTVLEPLLPPPPG